MKASQDVGWPKQPRPQAIRRDDGDEVQVLNMSRLLAFCAATCTMAVMPMPTAMMTETQESG